MVDGRTPSGRCTAVDGPRVRPPALAQALIAAAAPSSEYEIVAGDLHEEYLRIVSLKGVAAANHWYWTQALLSIPSLLSYSRSNVSVLRGIGVAFTALATLVAMLAVLMAIDTILGSGDRIAGWMYISINYADAIIFGALLAWLVRPDGLRVTFLASLFLVFCFVVPALAGHRGSEAPLAAWIVLCGGIPAMCIGAGVSQAIQIQFR